MNGMMLQGFSWYLPSDGQHWRRIAQRAPELAALGFTAIWLPPAYKGQAGISDVGYGVYDMWDLGEFDQRETVPTKYGERKDYIACIKALRAEGIQVLADIVFNHRMGGDELEYVYAHEVDPYDRNEDLTKKVRIGAWSRFTFPGRGGKLDRMVWTSGCFTGCDWDQIEERSGVWRFANKHWAEDVDHSENGNFDYLMGMDLDFSVKRVYEQLVKWGKWYLRVTGVDGFRLDALKHISRDFYQRWLEEMRTTVDRELFVVGEYWQYDVNALLAYLGEEKAMSLFDVPLHFNFYNASENRDSIDFRQIFDNTLVSADPIHAVTFVENHDTQPDQALSSTVQHWFKPAAYAFILLREAGYPCVFFADLFGLPNDGIPAVPELLLLMEIRQKFAFGKQHDYFDAAESVGWTREGTKKSQGCAVIVSRQNGAEKEMYVGSDHAGEHWVCVLGEEGAVDIDEEGIATFPAGSALVTIYLPEKTAKTLSSIPIIVRPPAEE